MATKKFLKRFTDAIFATNRAAAAAPQSSSSGRVSVIKPAKGNINSILNDDCLVHIFRRLTLREMVLIRGVCSRWEAMVSLVGCKHVKTLQLEGRARAGGNQQNAQHRLLIAQPLTLNADICHWLLRLLPNIRSLSMLFCSVQIDELIYLLTNWTLTLRSVTLRNFAIREWEPIWVVLNQAPQLRELVLIDMEMLDYPNIDACDFTLVQRQLDRFKLDESMSNKIFSLFVQRFSGDKRRKCHFNVSDRKFEVMAHDAVGMQRVGEQFESIASMYRIFEEMIPHQHLAAPRRGILSQIPVLFEFRALDEDEDDLEPIDTDMDDDD